MQMKQSSPYRSKICYLLLVLLLGTSVDCCDWVVGNPCCPNRCDPCDFCEQPACRCQCSNDASYQHANELRPLISEEANPSKSKGEKLLDAVHEGREQDVKDLIKAGADVNVADACGRRPLHDAAMNGHIAIVKHLIERGANLNVYENKEELTPLHLAAVHGHLSVVKDLIEAGADVDITDAYERTPLHEAALKNHIGVIKLLLGAGARNTKDRGGRIPMDLAKRMGNVSAMDLLYRDINGGTKLHRAIMKVDPCLKEIKRLIALGVDVEAKGSNEWTALRLAVMRCYRDVEKAKVVMMALINAGADINARDSRENTALHWPSEHGHADVVKLLTDGGAKVGVRNVLGETPLHLAADAGYDKVVAILSNKATVEDVNNAYKIAKSNLEEPPAPLTEEEKEAYEDIIRLLKKKGANTAERKGR